jgi:hypothetical protein
MKKLVKENLNESSNSNEILAEIESALRNIIETYDLNGSEVEKLDLSLLGDAPGYGFVFEIKHKKMGGFYTIQYDATKNSPYLAGFEDQYRPYNDEEEFDDLEDAINAIEGWIEYALENW